MWHYAQGAIGANGSANAAYTKPSGLTIPDVTSMPWNVIEALNAASPPRRLVPVSKLESPATHGLRGKLFDLADGLAAVSERAGPLSPVLTLRMRAALEAPLVKECSPCWRHVRRRSESDVQTPSYRGGTQRPLSAAALVLPELPHLDVQLGIVPPGEAAAGEVPEVPEEPKQRPRCVAFALHAEAHPDASSEAWRARLGRAISVEGVHPKLGALRLPAPAPAESPRAAVAFGSATPRSPVAVV